MGSKSSASGQIEVVFDVVNHSGDAEFPGDREIEFVSIVGSETPDPGFAMSDVEAFKNMYNEIGDDMFFDDGLPAPVRIKAVGHLWFEYSNTTDGEDWDGGFEVDEWEEVKP